MNLSALGLHAISGGAGVLGGVTTTTGQGTVEFVMARYWSMSLNSGVSRNQQLDSTQRYDVQFAGVALHRITGRFTNLFLSYDFQRQQLRPPVRGPSVVMSGCAMSLGLDSRGPITRSESE